MRSHLSKCGLLTKNGAMSSDNESTKSPEWQMKLCKLEESHFFHGIIPAILKISKIYRSSFLWFNLISKSLQSTCKSHRISRLTGAFRGNHKFGVCFYLISCRWNPRVVVSWELVLVMSSFFPDPGGPNMRRLWEPAAAMVSARLAISCPRTSLKSMSYCEKVAKLLIQSRGNGIDVELTI